MSKIKLPPLPSQGGTYKQQGSRLTPVTATAAKANQQTTADPVKTAKTGGKS